MNEYVNGDDDDDGYDIFSASQFIYLFEISFYYLFSASVLE